MFRYTTLLALIFATTLATTHAEPPRFRAALRRPPNRFLARQEAEVTDSAAPEVAPPAAEADQPAPYPPAGVTPAIPFDLPTEAEAPAPDEVYGPPEEEPTPDPTYGPPEETTTLAAPAVAPADGDLVSQNLVQPRQRVALAKQRGLVRSQPLLLQAVPAAGAAGVVELVRAEPGVIYILK
ncbi:PREDICTED: skin secretory protein xP2-like [Rhagoletis zephyria]|uniref:skin secretory protein xP2-like n=1 Tax=Rhagoletis zephyria TaxID=28612 RepID=UPI0008115FB6|nr:PREDICTED: skin secretory protein xP2-like [Rhagoletis zephyria]